MRIRRTRTSVIVAIVGGGALWIVACGGTGTSPILNDASADGTEVDGGKGPRDGGGASDARAGKDTGPGEDAADSGGDGGSSACPDEQGSYTVTSSGKGCGKAFADSAPQCIEQTGCLIRLSSVAPSGDTALNTTTAIPISADGSFTGATIYEGDGTMGTPRTGCTGAWDSKTSTLTVDCGGMGASQSCKVTLTFVRSSCS